MNVTFGVAGFPLAFLSSALRKDRRNIFEWLKGLNLGAIELQMTYGPRMLPETCAEYRRIADELGIKITVHASYFIVFTSREELKIANSCDTLKRTYDLTDKLGADVVVLHPGPLYKDTPADAINAFIDNAGKTLDEIGKTEIGLFVETAGKLGQLGSVDEILSIADSVDGIHPCIDFGHVHARTLGTLENGKAIHTLTAKLATFLTERPSKRIHFHYTPIHYGHRGEIQHRAIDDRYPTLEQNDLFSATPIVGRSMDGWYHPRPNTVAQALKVIDRDFVVISETHNSQEIGAAALRNYFKW